MTGYPLYLTPPELAKSGADSTSEEAAAYRDWLIQSMPNRIGVLMAQLGVTSTGTTPDILLLVGDRAVSALQLPLFSIGTGADIRLTAEGLTLAADIGLFVADLLLRSNAELHWTIETRGGHRSFHLPVLRGTGDNSLDPIRASIDAAQAVLAGQADSTIWWHLFGQWSENANSGTSLTTGSDSTHFSDELFDIVAVGLDIAIDHTENLEGFLPFVIIDDAHGRAVNRIVADDFGEALVRARHLTRHVGTELRRWVVVFDGYWTFEGVRYETAYADAREYPDGKVLRFAQRYQRQTPSKITPTGNIAFLGEAPASDWPLDENW